MKRFRARIPLMLGVALCLLSSCEKNRPDETRALDVAEAMGIYKDSPFCHQTKAQVTEKSSYFYRNDFEMNWDYVETIESHTIVRFDVPTESKWDYSIILNTNDGKELLHEHHYITIVKDKETGKNAVYNRFLLSRDHDDKSKHDMSSFSGYEFFSDNSGRIIEMNIYSRGRNTLHYFVGYNSEKHNIMIGYLFARVSKYLRFSSGHETKTTDSSPYLCPVCGNNTFWEVGISNFVCTSCEYVVYAEEIDPSYCIDIYGSTGDDDSSGGNGDNPIDPWVGDDFGGASGGGSHNGQQPGTGNTSNTPTEVDINGITVIIPGDIDNELREWLLNGIETSLDYIAEHDVLSILLDELANYNVTLIYDPSLGVLANTHRSSATIRIKHYAIPIIAEELLHIIQYNDPQFRNKPEGYYEFEAKCMLTSVFGAQYLQSYLGGGNLWSYCQLYLSNRSDANFSLFRSALQHNSYDVSNLVNTGDMTPHLDTWDISCNNPR